MIISKIFNFIKARKGLIIVAVIVVIIVIIFFNPFSKKENGLQIGKVTKGTIVQEVSETGSIEPSQEIQLGFRTSGRVGSVSVKVGDVVARGAELASLDKANLFIQLDQARASLSVAQTQSSKLSKDARDAASQNLNDAYKDALNTLDDAYLKIYNAYNAVASLQSTYFSSTDQEGIKIVDNKALINDSLNAVKLPLDAAKISLNHNDIDNAISVMKNSLKNTSDALKIIREACEQGVYYSRITAADKTIIDNQKSYVITALTNTTNAEQTISSDKISLQTAEDQIGYYQAKVEESQANVNSLQQQILDATIRAPIAGVITKVDKKVGETIQGAELPITLISSDPLQIKVNIYEEEIVKIKVDNPVNIKVAAFPDETLAGKVIAIDPAEKLIDGVVYYEITIAFDQMKDGLKAGMTADIVIETARKDNILIIPREAVRENGKTTVLVYKNKETSERDVEMGLQGNNNEVEVISGLSEGEEIVIK